MTCLHQVATKTQQARQKKHCSRRNVFRPYRSWHASHFSPSVSTAPPPPVPCVCSRSLRARGMQALCPDCNPVQRDDPKTTTQIFHSIVTSKIRSWIAVENKANTTANRPRMLLPDPLTNMLNKTHSSRRGIVSAKFCFPPRAAGTAATHPSPASRKTLSHKLPSSCVCRRLAASFAPPPTPRGAR